MVCQDCKKNVNHLITLELHDGTVRAVCDDCRNRYEAHADLEYERQKEESL